MKKNSSHSNEFTKVVRLLNAAENLPLEELCKEGNYKENQNLRYPQTIGEQIVEELLSLLLDESLPEEEPIFDEMTSYLSQLDTGVNKPGEWRALFSLAKQVEG